MGVAALDAGETGEQLLDRADKALYRAKRRGGNGFEVA
jgi:PleD family two-component response regulator